MPKRSIVVLAAVLATSALFIGCEGSDSDGGSSSIVGVWSLSHAVFLGQQISAADAGYFFVLTLSADGTYTSRGNLDDVVEDDNGTYTFANGNLRYVSNVSAEVEEAPATVDGNTLRITEADFDAGLPAVLVFYRQ